MYKLLPAALLLATLLLLNFPESALPIAAEQLTAENAAIADDLPLLSAASLIDEPPTVLVVLLVRNKAHVLPYFLNYLERQHYPKDRIALWIRTDHNSDKSAEVLQLWLEHTAHLYHQVDFNNDNTNTQHQNESSPNDWPQARFEHLIRLKEQALKHAAQLWADFVFFVDADVLLTSPKTLYHLTSLRLPIVAPMLLSEGLYSNFWCGMTAQYYYQRTDEYKEIYNVQKEGHFAVPMVHSAVLVNMNIMGAQQLTFDRARLLQQQKQQAKNDNSFMCRSYDGPLDDIIVFAISANCSQIPLYVSNHIPYGYILSPLENDDELAQDLKQLVNIKTNIINDLDEVQPLPAYLTQYVTYPPLHKLSLNHIYMINLERRPDRRQKMQRLFVELGLDVEYFEAVDGKQLNSTIIKEMGIRFLPGYEDPYHHRDMTMGEVGCFLSHYRIWQRIVEKQQQEVLVLEDDIRFEPYFKERAERVLQQARSVVEYDLIYFGRKRLKDENEPWVSGTDNLVHVGYSYWTLGYVLSLQGAKKLLAAKPLENLIPVDEFLPVMFNRHPNNSWSAAFEQRNLYAFSAAPLLLFPTHYTGDVGYISDTEDSEVTSKLLLHGKQAQLKSDRELEFPINQHNNNNNMPEPLAGSIIKSHDEL